MRQLLIFILGLVSIEASAFQPYDPTFLTPQDEAAIQEEANDEQALFHLTALTSQNYQQSGMASMYWQPQPVACGGRLNPQAMTAAHKTLPCGSRVKVTSLNTGRSVTVTINDRGPYIKGRIIDLTRAAFARIDNVDRGVTRVKIERLSSKRSQK